jgi:hypothetical protein
MKRLRGNAYAKTSRRKNIGSAKEKKRPSPRRFCIAPSEMDVPRRRMMDPCRAYCLAVALMRAGRSIDHERSRITGEFGQGQVATSGMIARTNAIGGATVFPAVISIPDEMNPDSLRLCMSGTARHLPQMRALSDFSHRFLSGSAPMPLTSSQRRPAAKGVIARLLWHKLHIGCRRQSAALTAAARRS